ncbi:putative ycf22 [Gossypium arboreum]|uniref:Putative ycf22 n=1 Tax=Gossypium arboreum TaxID=29729 RepID=A0A0B0NLV4_GOSAR|nr:putative ycf22 [Gossypium arboreum]
MHFYHVTARFSVVSETVISRPPNPTNYRNTIKFYSAYGFVFRAQVRLRLLGNALKPYFGEGYGLEVLHLVVSELYRFEMSVDYNVDVDQEMYTGYDVSNELDGTESATPSVNIISTQQPNVK